MKEKIEDFKFQNPVNIMYDYGTRIEHHNNITPSQKEKSGNSKNFS